jgi:SNF2 family DNA or RNA helicase
LSRQTIEAPTPREVLAPFYVRTTKHELNLTPPIRDFVHIEMGPAQLALYSLLRSEALRQLAGIRNNKSAVDIIKARRCVMRLLQASTNPIAAVAAFEQRGNGPDGHLSRLFEAITREGDSNKLLRTVEFCEEQKRLGRKVVVWTIFKHTVTRLEALTSHLNSVSIFGETPVGSEDDDHTREGKVKRFHEDRDSWVLIANPAACSEGISLHKVCHDALYVDRSYNAAHYLQSIDRIHRLGLEPGVETRITIFQSVAPNKIGSIDHSVSRRLLTKMRAMERILDDEDIRQLALDEEEAAPPVDRDITLDDLADLLEQLTAQTIPAEEEQI